MRSASWAERKQAFFWQMLRRVRMGWLGSKKGPALRSISIPC
jgi:hypothetical protein